MKSIVKYLNVSYISFVLGIVFLVLYGVKYQTFSNFYLMVFTIPFILVTSVNIEILRFDINLLFLMETLFIKGMIDQHIGLADLVPTTMPVPILMYLFGKLMVTENNRDKNIGTQIRSCCAVISFILGSIIGYTRNKYLLDITVMYTKNFQWERLKTGVDFLKKQHWGNFGAAVGLETSSGCMWLDYGRQYGILVFVTLFIFFILTIKDTFKMLINRNINILVKGLLLIVFILLNVVYLIGTISYFYPCFWYVGLIINGIISVIANYERKNV